MVVLAALLALAQDADDIRRRIEDLAHEDLDIREEAAHRLRAAGRAAWPELRRALDHSDPEVRSVAAWLLDRGQARRRISHRILRLHPDAPALLQGGACDATIRLIRTLGRFFEEGAEILLDLLHDPDPEIRIAAAEALYDNRRHEWIEPLLALLAAESCPRAGRVQELLRSSSSHIGAEAFLRNLDGAGPLGSARLVELAAQAGLELEIPRPRVRDLLRDDAPRARRAALAWMRRRPNPEDAPFVEPLLDDSDDAAVADALSTLRALNAPTEPSRIRRLLAHEDDSVRSQALDLLARIDGAGADRDAEALLADPSTDVRRMALNVLWRIRGTGALERTLRVYLEESGDPRELAASCLLRFRAWTRPRALEALESPDADRRLRATELLYAIDGASALVSASADADDSVRRWALQRLLSHEGETALAALRRLSEDPSETVRFEAIRALVRRGEPKLDDLARFLESEEYTYVLGAAETLIEYGGQRVPEFARSALRRSDAHVRRLGLDALTDRRILDAAPQALEFLSDPDAKLRRSALQHLAQSLADRNDPQLVAAIRARVDATDLPAAQVLAEFGDDAVRSGLRSAVRDGRIAAGERLLRSLLSTAEAEIAGMLGDDAFLNARLVSLLAPLDRAWDRELASRLRELSASRDPEVRASAIRSIATLSLAALDDRAIAALDDPDAEVRSAGAWACGEREIRESAERLARLLDDEDPDVRERAAWALSRVAPASRATVARAAANEDCAWVRRRMEALLNAWR